jgi:hypothetical protein
MSSEFVFTHICRLAPATLQPVEIVTRSVSEGVKASNSLHESSLAYASGYYHLFFNGLLDGHRIPVIRSRR